MGFDLDRFTRAVDDDFKCSICLGVFETPLATPCGHVFCTNCVLPWVVQHGSCPLKCENFSTKELNSVLPLRNLILKLDIRCDNHRRGCQETIKIPMLSQHLEDCDYVPVQCSNKGCDEEVNIKDQVVHETQYCEFRPVGRCDKGCGLVLQHNGITDHVCLKALQTHANSLQSKIANQEHNLKKTTMRFGKREKSLLAQIACLQNEIQMQALRYQKKLNECKAELEYLTALAAYEKPNDNDEERLSLIIKKDNNNGSLGLNIIGGNRTEGGISEGIIVSRIMDGGAAARGNLKVHDRITKVNGIDLSKASHEEAVEAFKNAAEPIAVEVLRRAPRTTQVGNAKDRTVCKCSIGTQTDVQSEDFIWKMLQQCPSPLSPMSPMTPTGKSDVDFDGICVISPEEPLTVIDSELMNDLEGMDNLDMPIIDEDGLDKAYEMEYERTILVKSGVKYSIIEINHTPSSSKSAIDSYYEGQEMTLCRNNGSDKLGLTLCYGQEDDTGIFISEVDPNSIAGEDGRIKEGDQILQINSEDVHNKDQALELFAQQPETTMLVCRPQLRLEDCLYDERNALLDDLQLDMLEQTHQEAMQFTSSLLDDHDDDDDEEIDEHPDEDGQTDTTGTTTTGSTNPHEKDSGVGRATDGASNTTDDDSSIQKFPMDSGSLGSGEMRYSNDSFTSHETAETEYNGQISLEDCLKFQAALESKCDKHTRSDTDESLRGKDSKVMRLGSDSMETTSQSGDSLNRNCRNRLGSDPEEDRCLEQLNGHSSSQLSSPVTNGNMADVFGESKDIDTERDTKQIDDSSAKSSPKHRPGELVIDTEDSADSSPTPLIVQKAPKRQPSDSTVSSGRQHRAPRTVPGSPSRSKSSSSSRDRSKSDRSSSADSRKAKGSPAKTLSQQQHHLVQDRNVPLLPYPRRPATNPHLRQQQQFNRNPYLMQQEQAQLIRNNWKLQQQHQNLRTSMQKYGSMQSIMSIPAHAKHYRSYMHLVSQNEENALTAADSGTDRSSRSATEWKVKVRSDGTRYITKKSTARDRVLKERANRISEERGGGLTTDDEAVSEMKLGKYWSKEDRKRHLERVKDQKRRREFMMQSRMECLQEQDEMDGKKPVNIVELSHRMFLKKKGRKMLTDDFTTVQEMLVHGTRISPETAKEFNPWLNVTTV